MNDRYISINRNVDVDVDIDLDAVCLDILKANVLRRMQEGKIEPIPQSILQSIGQYNIDAKLIDCAYYAMTPTTPQPIRELLCQLNGRVA